MPNNILYEQLCIGLMISNQEAALEGVSRLNLSSFTDPSFQITFAAISELIKKDKEVNIYNVNAELTASGQVLSLEELLSIEDKFYIPEKFDAIIEELIDKEFRRTNIHKFKEVIKRLESNSEPSFEILKSTQIEIPISGNNRTLNSSNYIEQRRIHDAEKISRIPILTYFADLDNMLTYKMNLKEISIITARPNHGKSTFKANLIKNMCKNGVGVASFALEQSIEIESDRLEAIVSGISTKEIAEMKFWTADDPRHRRLHEAREVIASWNHYLIEGTGKSFMEISNEMRHLAAKGVKIFFFDLFDRLKEIGEAQGNTHAIIKGLLNKLLALVKELNVHTCLLVQISRKYEDRKRAARKKGQAGSRPEISDLKESGAYEEFARTIFILFNQGAEDDSILNPGLEVRIAKQNNGPLGAINLKFNRNNLQLKSDITGINIIKKSLTTGGDYEE